jgi:serine/threonine-protein kinase
MGQPIDHRADLYSMAVMVYEMLAGRVPFKGASPLAVILKHLNDSAPPPRQFNPSIPPHVETELLRVLSKRPENRHQSVAEFVLALASAGRTIYASPLSGVADQIRTLIGPDGKEYVQVPAGEFQMGGAENDSPTRRVYVDGFYISRHPVTNAEYHAFAEATGYRRPEYWKDGIYPDWQADHPVTYVNWHDAAAYCRWVGGRLPTEAEWEKAARGTDGRRYPWGGAFDTTRCNSREGAKEGTSTVGRYSPSGDSPYGVSDMAGNVWEWVLDWWVALESDTSLQQNPMGPAAGKTKVIRGGSYLNAESLVACHARDHARPEVGAVNYGFRVRMGEGMFTTSTGRTGKLWKIKRADT